MVYAEADIIAPEAREETNRAKPPSNDDGNMELRLQNTTLKSVQETEAVMEWLSGSTTLDYVQGFEINMDGRPRVHLQEPTED